MLKIITKVLKSPDWPFSKNELKIAPFSDNSFFFIHFAQPAARADVQNDGTSNFLFVQTALKNFFILAILPIDNPGPLVL